MTANNIIHVVELYARELRQKYNITESTEELKKVN